MIDLNELSQLVAFADLGTLSRVAEEFHISTPSITRSMQHLEEAFGVPLFLRGKNKIELNETGKMAVAAARTLLREAETTVRQVQEFDARQHTIIIKSCAPAPLWELQKDVNTQQPEMMVSSAICQNLFVCVPPDHELAKYEALTFADINGFNFLLRTELGFWDTLCREKMPASKFLVQPDAMVFEELVNASSLPCFTTDYVRLRDYPNRVNIPLSDEESHVTFYLAKR